VRRLAVAPRIEPLIRRGESTPPREAMFKLIICGIVARLRSGKASFGYFSAGAGGTDLNSV
jgi:hypothetical protein